MSETCKVIYDNKSQLLHQVGTSRHFHSGSLHHASPLTQQKMSPSRWRYLKEGNNEVDAKTKESTRKTEGKPVGRDKEGHERKKPNEGQWEDRKQWSLGVGQRRKTF